MSYNVAVMLSLCIKCLITEPFENCSAFFHCYNLYLQVILHCISYVHRIFKFDSFPLPAVYHTAVCTITI